jgi:hypothetical protein
MLMSITRCHWFRDISSAGAEFCDTCAVDGEAQRAERALGVPDGIGEHVGIHDIARYGDSILAGPADFAADLVQS